MWPPLQPTNQPIGRQHQSRRKTTRRCGSRRSSFMLKHHNTHTHTLAFFTVRSYKSRLMPALHPSSASAARINSLMSAGKIPVAKITATHQIFTTQHRGQKKKQPAWCNLNQAWSTCAGFIHELFWGKWKVFWERGARCWHTPGLLCFCRVLTSVRLWNELDMKTLNNTRLDPCSKLRLVVVMESWNM